MKNDSASRRFSQTRKVEVSIFTSLICPMSSACHGYSSQRVERIYGLFIEDRYVKKSRGDLSFIVENAVLLEYFLNEDMPIPVQFHVTI